MLAIIGGTGLVELPGLSLSKRSAISTPYGDSSGQLQHGQFAGNELLFLSRHGDAATVPPHRVNYRANIYALQQAGASAVVAVNAVGGIAKNLPPAALCVPHDLIDYSYGRVHSYFDQAGDTAIYADVTQPYTPSLRHALLSAAASAEIAIEDGGVYAVTQGPRLETAAEINRFERDGCDLVGMTSMPEAALARELELDYACLAVVINWAAGRSDGTAIHAEIEQHLSNGMAKAIAVLASCASRYRH